MPLLWRIASDKTKTRIIGTRRIETLFYLLTALEESQATECSTSYRTRHFFDDFTTNEDIATKFEADLPHCVRNVTTS
jgi:hypothetical protein